MSRFKEQVYGEVIAHLLETKAKFPGLNMDHLLDELVTDITIVTSKSGFYPAIEAIIGSKIEQVFLSRLREIIGQLNIDQEEMLQQLRADLTAYYEELHTGASSEVVKDKILRKKQALDSPMWTVPFIKQLINSN